LICEEVSDPFPPVIAPVQWHVLAVLQTAQADYRPQVNSLSRFGLLISTAGCQIKLVIFIAISQDVWIERICAKARVWLGSHTRFNRCNSAKHNLVYGSTGRSFESCHGSHIESETENSEPFRRMVTDRFSSRTRDAFGSACGG
jgi:hypothetical protein